MLKDTHSERTVGVVESQTLKLSLPPEGFQLEKGGVLPEIVVSYERCGAVTPDNRMWPAFAQGKPSPAAGGKA